MNYFSKFLAQCKHIINWTIKYSSAHKISSAIVVLVLLGGGWYVYGAVTSTTGQTRYILGTASTSTIIATVSASGQISATNSVDIKPKVTGDITWIGVKAGDKVSAGQALASIDANDASQAVTNARIALQSEQLTLAQQTEQAPIDYQKAKDAVTQAQQDLSDEYDTAYSTLSSAYITLPQSISTADNLLHANNFNDSNQNVGVYLSYFINGQAPGTGQLVNLSAQKAESDYKAARVAYTNAYTAYKSISRTSTSDQIEAQIQNTSSAAKLISQSISSDVNLIDSVVDYLTISKIATSTVLTSQQSASHSALTSINSTVSSLSSEVKSLQSAKTALTNAQQSLQIASIGNNNGSNPISLQQEQNAVEQKKAALASAELALADHTVRAPFAGTLSAVSAHVGDTAGSTAIATLITTQQIAQISVNEVDAAKLSVGQKATLTFDAIDDLTLTGTVAEIDTVGTVTQGVVSYTVKITLDSQDARIKPGMTVNASIQTAVHQDVLTVPSSAVKTTNGNSYVLVFDPPLTETANTQGIVSPDAPKQVAVQIGISDDTNVEILSGLTAGEQIVTRTATGVTTTAAPRTTTGTTGATRGGVGGGNATFIRGL